MSGMFIVGGSSAVYVAHMHKRKIEYKLTSAAMGDNTWRTTCEVDGICTDVHG